MMAQLNHNDAELQKQLEEEQFARAELERELHLMQQFIRRAGHDLKTPITTLKTSLYLVQRKAEMATPERLSMMEGQLERMSNMLDAMGLMARLDGQTDLNFDESDVMAIINEALWVVRDSADKKQVALVVEALDAIPEVALNFEECKRALVNLLDNAIRYTPESGEVLVQLDVLHGYLCVDVIDRGVGLSDEEVSHLFERFYRGDDAGSTHEMGAGMGLAIVKRIVDLHGGKIRVMTEAGAGTSFRLMFPIADA